MTENTERWGWEFHPDRPEKRIALVAGDEDIILASGDDGRAWLEVSDEDARKVEAIPDLLSALETMRKWAIPGMDWTDEIGREILAKVDAAIAKAEGR